MPPCCPAALCALENQAELIRGEIAAEISLVPRLVSSGSAQSNDLGSVEVFIQSGLQTPTTPILSRAVSVSRSLLHLRAAAAASPSAHLKIPRNALTLTPLESSRKNKFFGGDEEEWQPFRSNISNGGDDGVVLLAPSVLHVKDLNLHIASDDSGDEGNIVTIDAEQPAGLLSTATSAHSTPI